MINLRELSKTSIYSAYKKYQLNKSKKRSRQVIKDYLQHNNVRKLQIGAGGHAFEGWLNVDLEPVHEKVIYFDAATTFPLPDNSFDYIFSEHVFEHLSLSQQMIMLKESARVLKPGGKMRIATPNLDVVLNIRNNNTQLIKDYISWSAEIFFPQHLAAIGNEVKDEIFVINNYFYSWGHQFIHNPQTLQLLLQKTGYKDIQQVAVYTSTDAALQNLERHGTVIPKQFNDMETMVFEASK